MADALWMKLRKVTWEDYEVSPRCTKQVPRIIEALSARKESKAMKAAHDLWVALCSEKVWPAAEPACPFLFDVLRIAQPAVQGEIIDILMKFAEHPPLQTYLREQQAHIHKLTTARDEIVAAKAEDLLTKL